MGHPQGNRGAGPRPAGASQAGPPRGGALPGRPHARSAGSGEPAQDWSPAPQSPQYLFSLPPPAQGAIQGDDVGQFLAADLNELQLCVEQLAFGIEVFQVAGDAAPVSEIGEIHPLAEALDEPLLLG